ncbi:hypothetical protein LJC26_04150 [Desulfovibrio sp. OttesenSCG-928-O18]|nr:hypothetical protein [Desulfovibrio sp. OttesenSCG-928-O18]
MNVFTSIRPAFLLPLLLGLILLGGCGKEGMPSPKKTQDTFTITGAGASPMGNCLVAKGTVAGAIANMDTMMIEVAPILSYDDCPGCPFVAQEYSEFSASGIDLDRKSGQFMFSFCPSTPAPMYRWRLVGKNVFPGLPHATTTPQVVIVRE